MTSSLFSRSFVRRSLSALAALALPLLLGGWFWMDGKQSTLDPAGPVAAEQAKVFYVTVYVTTVIFVIVAAIFGYATLKFKARNSSDEHAAPPEQSHGNPLVELSLIGGSVLALVIIAIPTLRVVWYSYDVPAAEQQNMYEVNATGFQWWFRFEYPHEKVNESTTLVAANELVIPAGRPVRINLRTTDVIHSFWVPRLAGKVDMIPNRANKIWMQADKPGYFWGQCAEYCGESHAVMRFRVIALAEKDFADWLAQQKNPARTVAPATAGGEKAKAEFASYKFEPMRRNAPGYSEDFDSDPLNAWVKQQFPDKDEDAALIAEGRKVFGQKGCTGCHTVRGHEGGGNVGPDLTHIGSRTTIAGGLLNNTKQNLHRWVTDPNNVKPGNKMYYGSGAMPGYMRREGDTWVQNFTVNHDEARALVAYLHSLK
jgi:cytochrome c oxidase subunit II